MFATKIIQKEIYFAQCRIYKDIEFFSSSISRYENAYINGLTFALEQIKKESDMLLCKKDTNKVTASIPRRSHDER